MDHKNFDLQIKSFVPWYFNNHPLHIINKKLFYYSFLISVENSPRNTQCSRLSMKKSKYLSSLIAVVTFVTTNTIIHPFSSSLQNSQYCYPSARQFLPDSFVVGKIQIFSLFLEFKTKFDGLGWLGLQGRIVTQRFENDVGLHAFLFIRT